METQPVFLSQSLYVNGKAATFSFNKIMLKVQFGLFACPRPPEMSTEASMEEALGAVESEQSMVDTHGHASLRNLSI